MSYYFKKRNRRINRGRKEESCVKCERSGILQGSYEGRKIGSEIETLFYNRLDQWHLWCGNRCQGEFTDKGQYYFKWSQWKHGDEDKSHLLEHV